MRILAAWLKVEVQVEGRGGDAPDHGTPYKALYAPRREQARCSRPFPLDLLRLHPSFSAACRAEQPAVQSRVEVPGCRGVLAAVKGPRDAEASSQQWRGLAKLVPTTKSTHVQDTDVESFQLRSCQPCPVDASLKGRGAAQHEHERPRRQRIDKPQAHPAGSPGRPCFTRAAACASVRALDGLQAHDRLAAEAAAALAACCSPLLRPVIIKAPCPCQSS